MKNFLVFLLLFLLSCAPTQNEESFKIVGNISLNSENGVLRIFAGGSEIADITGTVAINKKIYAYFFTGYTKFEEEYLSEDKGGLVSLSPRVALWKNGIKVEFSPAGGSILKAEVSSPKGNSVRLIFRCRDIDHFLGFGAQTYLTDQKGEAFNIWVSEEGIRKIMESDTNPLWFVVGSRHTSYYPLPYFYDPAGFGFLVDTSYRSKFNLCKGDENHWSVEVDATTFDLYFIVGKTPKEVIEEYTTLTGKPILPQRWYFSPWNDAIGGKGNVEQVANILRSNGIPSTAIWTEDWGGEATRDGDLYRFVYNWDVGRDLYPDFETMVTWLHKEGFHFLVYFNSFLDPNSRVWNEVPGNFFVMGKEEKPYNIFLPSLTWGGLLDLTNQDAWNWAEEKMLDAIKLGVNGWMADYGEWLPYDSMSSKGPGSYYHNLYPLLWHSLNRDVMDKYTERKNFVYFTRSGYIGDQALTPVYWPGDQSTDFSIDDGFPTAIAVGINVGWSGTVMYGSDIAGYMSIGNPPSDKELFLRWTEFGAFSPVMRTHHGYLAFANWNFHRDNYTLQWYKFYAIWHQRLFPYLYSEAISAGAEGIPLIRHMYMEFPEDQNTISLQTQYMLGPFLLVAPVEERGAVHKITYFPRGRWYNFWDGSVIESKGQWLEVNAPLERIPVYVREGGIIELLPSDIDTIEAPPGADSSVVTLDMRDDWREVHFYKGKNLTWKDYEGNVFYNYLTGVLDTKSLTLNSETLPLCENNTPSCYFEENGEITIRVRSNGEEPVLIKDDRGNKLKIETAKTRWWEIKIYQ